jgi:CRISPR/Cas system-associated exonuclease Cas4 (RecB family)
VASGADVAAAMERAVSIVTTPDVAARASERTLATLRALAAQPRPDARGRANHVTERNPLLRSALRRMYRLETPKLGRSDGLVLGPSDPRAALAAHAPASRPFSATALESFAKCPLQFHLKAVLRLEPREEPVKLEALDPLVRGSIFHEAQFLTLIALREDSITAEVPALAKLGEVFARLRTALVDRLVPAIPRVFHAELDLIEGDLREWLVRVIESGPWKPRYFELAFGLPPGDDGRDPASRADPVPLVEGIRLRGAIDMVEQNAETGALRATDHKTGSNYPIRGHGDIVVRGGQTLQPVLYALALGALFPGTAIAGGRLWYCTTKGGYAEYTVPLDDEARASAKALATAVTEATTKGLLPAAPIESMTCAFCDFSIACGPQAFALSLHLPITELETGLPALVQLRRRR